jgi:hypothetical protein
MKRWTPEALPARHLEGKEELHVWGHDFNARSILENNHGHSDYVLQCPQGVTGCCSNYTPRQSHPRFLGPSNYHLKSLKRKAPL